MLHIVLLQLKDKINSTSRYLVGIVLLFVGLSLASAFILTIPHTVRADPAVLYAAPSASGSGDCSSWANACDLQTALATAQGGDQIWVKEGVHIPGASRTDAFTLKDDVAAYGGFAGTETSLDQRDWQAHVTVLSGDISRDDITDPNGVVTDTTHIVGDNSYRVIVTGNLTDTAVLDGFTITGGQANGTDPNDCGGGMYNDASSPTLRNVVFSGNAANAGGGMCNFNASSPMLTNVTFRGNAANDYGGGMYNTGNSNPTLTDVIFEDNSSSGYGGGLENVGSSPALEDVVFTHNTAQYGGGGMANTGGSNPTLTNVAFFGNSAAYGGAMASYAASTPGLWNVLFSGNSATTSGGAIYNNHSRAMLTNVTLSGNSANVSGGGIYNLNVISPPINNAILWGNTAPGGSQIYNDSTTPIIATSDIQRCGGSGAGWDSDCGMDVGGNIDADPLFVDADGPDDTPGTYDDDLHLQSTSPAIDAGDNDSAAGLTTDLDGNPRFVDIPSVPDSGYGTPPIVDMGAYEVQGLHYIFLPLVLRH